MENFDWEQLLADCVDFTQRLIQTPSMSHEEGPIAELVAAEMRELQFEGVEIDAIGNVSGRIPGRDPELGALVLNTHLDHVDPGDLALWPAPPFSGKIVGSVSWGAARVISKARWLCKSTAWRL